jgi:hypothetical protein
LPASASIRHTPTTGTSDFGSAPAVSFAKSILSGCCAAAGGDSTAMASPARMIDEIILVMV